MTLSWFPFLVPGTRLVLTFMVRRPNDWPRDRVGAPRRRHWNGELAHSTHHRLCSRSNRVQAAFKANSRNAGLLEDFLIRRSQSSGQTNEEQLAQEALAHGTISKKTGEMDSHNSGVEGRDAAARAAQNGTAGTAHYGWGSGDGATETTHAPINAAGTTKTYGTTASTPSTR